MHFKAPLKWSRTWWSDNIETCQGHMTADQYRPIQHIYIVAVSYTILFDKSQCFSGS